jgi:PAS domain S-box-containing protein
VKRRLVYLAQVVALATLYLVAARAGLVLDAVAGFAALVWPPSGIALAALLTRGYRLWPGVFLGAFFANVLTGAPLLVAFGIGAGNTLEALLGAYALGRIPGFRNSIDRLRDVLGLIVLAAASSTTVSATIGVSSLYLGGIVSLEHFWGTWRAWWLGDLIGDLLVAPALLVWATRPRLFQNPKRLLEAAALGVGVVAVSLLIFGTSPPSDARTVGQAYMYFPLLIWAALRFGQRGAVSTAFVISLIAVFGTVVGRGPFIQPVLHQSLFALQTFMGVAAATFLVLGASVSERRRAVDDLRTAITEQERLLAERDLAHQRLVTVLEQSPLAIGVVEARSGRFVFVNDEAERLLGRRPTLSKAVDPDGGGWQGFHPDGHRIAPHEWPLARAMRRGEVVRNEIARIERADGGSLEVSINAAPVRDTSGEIIAGVLIFWDVTAQRLAEEELRRAHETAAQANRAKSAFLAVMSHELRTPLNAIGGHVQLVEMGVHGAVNDAQRDALGRVQRNQRHLLSLINDLLNLARIETGRVEYTLEDIPLAPLLADVTAMVEPLLSAKQLTCEIATWSRDTDRAPTAVRADREKVKQIALNLLTNAIKYTPEGGRITVDTGPSPDAPEMACIHVRDTGIGIPAAKLETVFEPFVQLARRPLNQPEGVGLGLAISRDLARGMAGDLAATSTVGEGTTLTLTLPRAVRAAATSLRV